jgi:hypothetical protein
VTLRPDPALDGELASDGSTQSFQGVETMNTGFVHCVAGLFTSHEQAEAARQDLRRIGLEDRAVEVSIPEPGHYKIEYHESSELGRGAAIGAVIGMPVGIGVAIAVLLTTVPSMDRMTAIGLGILLGSLWGPFFGGLGGIVPKVLAQTEEKLRHTIAADTKEVFLIAEAGGQTSIARKVMRRHGARRFLAGNPGRQPRRVPVATAHEHPALLN